MFWRIRRFFFINYYNQFVEFFDWSFASSFDFFVRFVFDGRRFKEKKSKNSKLVCSLFFGVIDEFEFFTVIFELKLWYWAVFLYSSIFDRKSIKSLTKTALSMTQSRRYFDDFEIAALIVLFDFEENKQVEIIVMTWTVYHSSSLIWSVQKWPAFRKSNRKKIVFIDKFSLLMRLK